MNPRCEKAADLLTRCYTRMLAAYPADFRHEYGTEMARLFRDDCLQIARRGRLRRLIWQGLRTLADLALTAPEVHMEILKQDLRFALRMLRINPGFALAAILALSLGIGANSAIFSLVYGILVSPLPFPDPGRLLMIWEKNPRGIERNNVSPPNFADYRSGAHSLAGMAAFYEAGANLTGVGEPEHLLSAVVTPDFFDVLGVRPQSGSGLTRPRSESDPAEVVLSHGLWQRRFNQDPAAIGKFLGIDDRDYAIRGVMPEGFEFPSPEVALWTTMPLSDLQTSRQAHFLSTVARLKAGTSLSQARAELEAQAAGLARSYPVSNRGWSVTLVPLKEQIVGSIRLPLVVLLGAVACILLIACANFANLLLARVTRRHGEIAVRTALGANPSRIVRQMLTESVLLAAFGGAAALGLSWFALKALAGSRLAAIPRLDEVGVNLAVIGFTLALALLTGIVSGLAPVLRLRHVDLHEGLKQGMTNRKSLAGHKLRGILVAAEVGLSLLLLLGAGLLVRTFVNLQHVNPGFEPRHAMAFTIDLPPSRHNSLEPAAAFIEEATTRVRALPGVESAGMISNLPLTGGEGYNRFGFTIEGGNDSSATENDRFYARWITPGYFASMGIPLLHGRDFSARDRAGSPPAVIIDAALARRYFPHENPVGRFVRLSYARSVPREIIGVCGEVRVVSLTAEPAPQIYIPILQEPRLSAATLVVRASRDLPVPAEAVLQELRRTGRNRPVYDIRPLADHVAQTIAPRRINMLLMGLLAGLAVVLTAVGVYAVISCLVAERRHEIGIRVALGARRGGILLLMVRQGMRHALAGTVAGVAASLVLTKAMAGLLFGVAPLDPWSIAAATLLTVLVAFMACLVPAWRAARVDPVNALNLR